MKKLINLVIVSILLLVGCKTNPPNPVENLPAVFGKVFVSSSINGGAIFVDNQNTGKVTPDTISVVVGTHIIRIEKEGYISVTEQVVVEENLLKTVSVTLEILNAVKIVLLEDFANVSCVPCVTSNKIIESLTNVFFGRAKVVAIKFPTNFPSPSDLFYLSGKPDCDARRSYYTVNQAPTTFVDGKLKPIPSDSNDVKAKIQSQLSQQPKFRVDVKDSSAGGQYYIKVKVIVYDTSGLDIQNLVLHTVVTETDIVFSTPPGSNGETKFYDVMRKMLPGNTGETLGSIAPGTVLDFERQAEISPKWGGMLHVIVFIQDKNSREVYQTGSTF